MQIRTLSILLFFMLLFSACKEEDNGIDIPTDGGEISAKINGKEFSTSGILVTAEYNIQNETIHSLAIGGAKLPVNGVTEAIALAIVSTDASGINVGDTYTATSTTKIAGAEYVFDDNTTDIKALSGNTDVVTITITDIDFDKKLVSGTFTFDGTDDDDPNTIYEVRDGIFKDVSFS